MRIPITGNRDIDEASMRAAIAADAAARQARKWGEKAQNLPVFEEIGRKMAKIKWKINEIARIVRL